jgi:hypothetical protein
MACVTLCACQTSSGAEREDAWPTRDGEKLSGFVWVPFGAPLAPTPGELSEPDEEVGVLDPWSSEPEALQAQPMAVVEDMGEVVKLRSLRTDELEEHCPAGRRAMEWEAAEFVVYARRADLLGVIRERAARRFKDGTGWSAVAGTPVGRAPTGEPTIAEGKLKLPVELRTGEVAWSWEKTQKVTQVEGSTKFEPHSVLVLDGRAALRAGELDAKMRVIRTRGGSTLARVLNVMDAERAEKLRGISGECVGLTVDAPRGYVWTSSSMSEPERDRNSPPRASRRSARANPRVVRDLGLMSGMRMTWRSGEPAGVLRRAAVVAGYPIEQDGERWCFELKVLKEDVCVDPSELP